MPDNPEAPSVSESRDGVGSGDHDEPYEFGRRLSSTALSPFTFRQYARLQIMRGRFEKQDPHTEPATEDADHQVGTPSASFTPHAK